LEANPDYGEPQSLGFVVGDSDDLDLIAEPSLDGEGIGD
jgi:hypothetical protein